MSRDDQQAVLACAVIEPFEHAGGQEQGECPGEVLEHWMSPRCQDGVDGTLSSMGDVHSGFGESGVA